MNSKEQIARALAELLEAADDVLDHTPENRSPYPDGPCINRQERRDLVTATESARAILATHRKAGPTRFKPHVPLAPNERNNIYGPSDTD